MKKRTLILLVMVAMIMCLLTACGNSRMLNTEDYDIANFNAIEDQDYLAYSKDTKVVYYMYSTVYTDDFSYTYFAPYISENGHFCKYINDEIVEITDNINN